MKALETPLHARLLQQLQDMRQLSAPFAVLLIALTREQHLSQRQQAHLLAFLLPNWEKYLDQWVEDIKEEERVEIKIRAKSLAKAERIRDAPIEDVKPPWKK
jgi:hypothetical protein